MIHPANADEAVDRFLMLIGDLGVGLADLASIALPDNQPDLVARFEALGRLGANVATLAAAGNAVLATRSPESSDSSD